MLKDLAHEGLCIDDACLGFAKEVTQFLVLAVGRIANEGVYLLEEIPPVIFFAIGFNGPILFSIGDGDIFPLPAAFESAVDGE